MTREPGRIKSRLSPHGMRIWESGMMSRASEDTAVNTKVVSFDKLGSLTLSQRLAG
jgi:hypothetical protein